MMKKSLQWGAVLAACLMLVACSSEKKQVSSKQVKQKQPAVISAMAQAKALNTDNEEIRLTKSIDAKKKLAKKTSFEAMLPTRSDQYTILFDLNSNGLNNAYKGELTSFAEFLRKNPSKKIHVDGFTCELGSAEYNVALGQRRAYAVAKYLESKGVPSNQIVLVSYGKERPADPSHNELAWMKNRRVEVFF